MVKETTIILTSVLSFLFGGWSLMLTILLVLNIIDYATGMMSAYFNGEIQSGKGFKGIGKKMMIWVWVIVANFLDLILKQQGLQLGEMLVNVVAIWFVVNEVTSIAENSVKLGVELPGPIAKGLDILNSQMETKGEKK